MNNKPIEHFKNNKEFQACAKYWQHKLFLDDWFIKFELVDNELYMEDDTLHENLLFGICYKNHENHDALIQISNKESLQGYCTRNIEELTLIHELLHCLIFPLGVDKEKSSYESVYMELDNHIKLEQISKSLLMAKYNLDYDYFRR